MHALKPNQQAKVNKPERTNKNTPNTKNPNRPLSSQTQPWMASQFAVLQQPFFLQQMPQLQNLLWTLFYSPPSGNCRIAKTPLGHENVAFPPFRSVVDFVFFAKPNLENLSCLRPFQQAQSPLLNLSRCYFPGVYFLSTRNIKKKTNMQTNKH